MLVRFILSNFLSFKEETEFNMLSSADQKHHKNHIYTPKDLGLLKTAALYGANGAGKSNFIKGISVFQDIIEEGGKDSILQIKKYKLELEYSSKPTTFEIEFVKNKVVYLYGLVINEEIIKEEWLYKSGKGKGKDEVLFHRTLEGDQLDIVFAKEYQKTQESRTNLSFLQNNLLENNTLLFKILADLKEGFKDVKDAYEWFEEDLIIIFPSSKPGLLIPQLIDSEKFKIFANDSLCSFHTGIANIAINTFPIEDYFGQNDSKIYERIKKDLKNKKTTFIGLRSPAHSEQVVAMIEDGEPVIKRVIGKHQNKKGEYVDFFLNEESDGTNRLLDLIPALYDFLTSPSVVLIDEIDQSIHPVLLKEIIKKFVSDSNTEGQLIFSTHEANLLDQEIFRRDEIWFVEKDQGETKMYPLSDYDIRFDLDIRKGYLNGRFGAIPFIGNLRDLNWDHYAEAK